MPLLAYMCCTDHPTVLPLIQPAFDLMDQHIARPAVFSNLFGIPNMLICILHLVHQGNMVIPSNLCSRLLHKFIVRIASW